MPNTKHKLLAALFERDQGRCMACGDPVTLIRPERGKHDGKIATIGHIVPRAMGGRATIRNARLECHDCNTAAGAKLGRDLYVHSV